jgi:hypothetical protein
MDYLVTVVATYTKLVQDVESEQEAIDHSDVSKADVEWDRGSVEVRVEAR